MISDEEKAALREQENSRVRTASELERALRLRAERCRLVSIISLALIVGLLFVGGLLGYQQLNSVNVAQTKVIEDAFQSHINGFKVAATKDLEKLERDRSGLGREFSKTSQPELSNLKGRPVDFVNDEYLIFLFTFLQRGEAMAYTVRFGNEVVVGKAFPLKLNPSDIRIRPQGKFLVIEDTQSFFGDNKNRNPLRYVSSDLGENFSALGSGAVNLCSIEPGNESNDQNISIGPHFYETVATVGLFEYQSCPDGTVSFINSELNGTPKRSLLKGLALDEGGNHYIFIGNKKGQVGEVSRQPNPNTQLKSIKFVWTDNTQLTKSNIYEAPFFDFDVKNDEIVFADIEENKLVLTSWNPFTNDKVKERFSFPKNDVWSKILELYDNARRYDRNDSDVQLTVNERPSGTSYQLSFRADEGNSFGVLTEATSDDAIFILGSIERQNAESILSREKISEDFYNYNIFYRNSKKTSTVRAPSFIEFDFLRIVNKHWIGLSDEIIYQTEDLSSDKLLEGMSDDKHSEAKWIARYPKKGKFHFLWKNKLMSLSDQADGAAFLESSWSKANLDEWGNFENLESVTDLIATITKEQQNDQLVVTSENSDRDRFVIPAKSVVYNDLLTNLANLKALMAAKSHAEESHLDHAAHDGADKSVLTSDFITLSLSRFLLIALILFAVQLMINLSRYFTRLSAYYNARADGIALILSDNDLLKGKLPNEITAIFSSLSPDLVDFGKTPNTPFGEITEAARKLAEAAANIKK